MPVRPGSDHSLPCSGGPPMAEPNTITMTIREINALADRLFSRGVASEGGLNNDPSQCCSSALCHLEA
jgi:hypothetical protein